MAATRSQRQTPHPQLTPAYLAASAAYHAGFRGRALVVMTAISGRESSWSPEAANTGDPAGGSYGLWQINGSHNPHGGYATSSYKRWLYNPLNNAREAYLVAEGNSLHGVCGNWYVDPRTGNSCGPGASQPSYGIRYQQHYAAAEEAARQVQEFGPASKATIEKWSPNAASASGKYATSSTSAGGGESLCGHAPNGTNHPDKPFTFPHTSVGLTYCQLKAIGGALLMIGGAGTMLAGFAILAAKTFGTKIPLPGPVGAAAAAVGGSSFKKAKAGPSPEDVQRQTQRESERAESKERQRARESRQAERHEIEVRKQRALAAQREAEAKEAPARARTETARRRAQTRQAQAAARDREHSVRERQRGYASKKEKERVGRESGGPPF